MKRILAFFLCVLLCFAPMSLMVLAGEMNDVCPHVTNPKLTRIARGTLVYEIYYYETQRCCYKVWENSTYTCTECGHEWTGTFSEHLNHDFRTFATYKECWRCNHKIYF